MSHSSSTSHASTRTFSFRDQLVASQPSVLRWLEEHLEGAQQLAAVELAARYFATSARWGDAMPKLDGALLNKELAHQLGASADSAQWLANLPIAVTGPDQESLGPVLRALVRVSQRGAQA